MKQKSILFLALCISLTLTVGLLAGLALAREENAASADTAPTVVSYQGEVQVDDQPYNGTGYFKFAIVDSDGDTTYWSNDGTSSNGLEPTNAEELSVENGLFAILLGNSASPYFMPAINASVFVDEGRQLHVWFDADGTGNFTDLGLTMVAAVPYALNAETLDGRDGSYYDQHYDHVIVVAKNGGDYTTIGDALDDILDNGSESRYLIWVAPGIYTETVIMKEYVDIEGAGELLTTISNIGSELSNTGTVRGASNAELSFLTVRNTGGAAYANAIYNSLAAVRLFHVNVSASGGTTNNIGVFNSGACAAILDNVTVSATGGSIAYGIFNTSNSTVTLTSVNASASGASSNNRGVVNLTSPVTMEDVTATASGIAATAVHDDQSTVTMTQVTANATGPGWCIGVNHDTNPLAMTDVVASGTGGTNNVELYLYNSSSTIRNSKLTAGAGTTLSNGLNTSITTGSSFAIKMDNCQIKGAIYSIYNNNGNGSYTLYAGTSMLDNTAGGNGTYHCVFSYDETYTALNGSCQ